MTLTVFEAAQSMAKDLKSSAFMVATFVRMAQQAMEEQRYEDASICLENAATWALSVKRAANGKAAKPAKKAAR